MSFTWVPIYTELAAKIISYRNRQKELLKILADLKNSGVITIFLNDYAASGTKGQLEEIDPFTLFASFNRGIKDEHRIAHLVAMKKFFGLASDVPGDFDGIPLVDNSRSWFFAFAKDRKPGDIESLWKLATHVCEGGLELIPPDLFARCLDIFPVGVAKLTIGMFWMNPRQFLPADSKTVAYGKTKGILAEPEDFHSYRQWLKEMTEQVGNDYPQVSHDAHLFAIQGKSRGFIKWMGPLLDALRALGGSGTPKAVQQQVQKMLKLPDTVNAEKNKSGQSKFYNELHWARQYLVWEGLLENQTRGQWVLTEKGNLTVLDNQKAQEIAEKLAAQPKQSAEEESNDESSDLPETPTESTSRQYWTLSAGTGGENWEEFYEKGIAAIGWDNLLDLREFKNKEELRLKLQELLSADSSKKNDALACWQFTHDVAVGDIIFAKQGFAKLLGCGVVEGDYEFDDTRMYYKHVRKVKWFAKGEWEMPEDSKMAMKTLTNVTPFTEWIKRIADMVGFEIGTDLNSGVSRPAPTGIAYWWLNANPKIWDIRTVPVGTVETYTTHNEVGNKRQKYKHFAAVRPGDLVLGYVTNPDKEVVALCEITKALHKTSEGEVIEFKKIEQFAEPVTWAELQAIPALAQCEPIQSNQGSLFTITSDEYDTIRALIDDRNPGTQLSKPVVFTISDALKGLFMSPAALDEILARLKRKKALILQGPPGVGKTFIARRLAFALMGERDERRVKMIQFHPSYGYEDFVQGFRPTRTGLERRDGVFYQFARLARNDPNRDWFFIIDEINRGNLAKIFGELLMLIETDKRGPAHAIPLTYSDTADETFYLPANLHFIGTMNTADRSLAMVDYALRRRFAFKTLDPAVDSSSFAIWLKERNASNTLIERIRTKVGNLNDVIEKERDLGSGFRIGHSFFCPPEGQLPDEAWFHEVITGEIQPLLEEYFDSSERVKKLVADLLAE